MPESLKLRRLREMRSLITSAKNRKELTKLSVADTDGSMVNLSADNALEVVDRRIAEEEAPPQEQVVEAPAETVVEKAPPEQVSEE